MCFSGVEKAVKEKHLQMRLTWQTHYIFPPIFSSCHGDAVLARSALIIFYSHADTFLVPCVLFRRLMTMLWYQALGFCLFHFVQFTVLPQHHHPFLLVPAVPVSRPCRRFVAHPWLIINAREALPRTLVPPEVGLGRTPRSLALPVAGDPTLLSRLRWRSWSHVSWVSCIGVELEGTQ